MRALVVVVLVVMLVGCTANAPVINDAKPDAPKSYTQTLPDGPCAVEGVTGAVPGITLAIRSDSCVFHRGTPGRFTYEVTASAGAPAITVPDSGGGCGRCAAYTSDALSFTAFYILGTSAGGEDQQYCLCDVGCCPPTAEQTIQLDVTTSTSAFDWSGRTWTGPSDTPTEMGDFFLPGKYRVTIGFAGFAAGSMTAELPIEVID